LTIEKWQEVINNEKNNNKLMMKITNGTEEQWLDQEWQGELLEQ